MSLPDELLLARIASLESEFAPQHATARAHWAVSPLFVSLAEALLVRGRGGEALTLLFEREAAAIAARDEKTVQDSALAIMRVLRRMRLDERLGQARELSVADRPDIRAEALAVTALIAGDRPRATLNTGAVHTEWRVWTPHNQMQVDEWRRRMERDDELGSPQAEAEHALDRLELALVLKGWEGESSIEAARAEATRAIDDFRRLRRGRPDARDHLRLGMSRIGLRTHSLGLSNGPKVDEQRSLHTSGEVALEEGELLALRLPDRAALLLARAERLLARSGDHLNAFSAALLRAIAHVHAGDIEKARGCAEKSSVVTRTRERPARTRRSIFFGTAGSGAWRHTAGG